MARRADSPSARKARGAFFTPPAIADFLTDWAIADDPNARILDPTCGEAVFLLSAGRQLGKLGTDPRAIKNQLTGVDLHAPSLQASRRLLRDEGFDANLVVGDFFEQMTPAQLGGDEIGWHDAVVGNPPFVRYQEHIGDARKRSAAA